MRLIAIIPSFAALVLATACGSGTDAAPAKPRTPAQQRAVDSTIGESRLPGAGVVKGALAVSDSAAAKRRLEDSIATNP